MFHSLTGQIAGGGCNEVYVIRQGIRLFILTPQNVTVLNRWYFPIEGEIRPFKVLKYHAMHKVLKVRRPGQMRCRIFIKGDLVEFLSCGDCPHFGFYFILQDTIRNIQQIFAEQLSFEIQQKCPYLRQIRKIQPSKNANEALPRRIQTTIPRIYKSGDTFGIIIVTCQTREEYLDSPFFIQISFLSDTKC